MRVLNNAPGCLAECSSFPRILSGEYNRRRSGAARCYIRPSISRWRNDIPHAAPRALPVDELFLVKAVHRFRGKPARASRSGSVNAGWIVTRAADVVAVIGYLPAGLRPGRLGQLRAPAIERKPNRAPIWSIWRIARWPRASSALPSQRSCPEWPAISRSSRDRPDHPSASGPRQHGKTPGHRRRSLMRSGS